MASIVVVSGVSRGNYLQLEQRVLTIGRDEGCDMQVLDAKVSRRHLEVGPDPTGTRFVVTDISAYGARLNGTTLTQSTPLRDNDVLAIGDSKLVFTVKVIRDQPQALSFVAPGEHDKRTVAPDRR